MNLKPYPEYKDSGVQWLGDVPKHWKPVPGMAVFAEKQNKNIGMKEKTVLSLSYGRIIVKPLDKLHGLVPESFETYQIVDPGDIIIRSTDLQNDKTSLRVGKVRNKGIITSAYLCLKTKNKLNSDYGHLLLHGFDLMKVFYGMGSGLRQNLSWIDFKRMPIALPCQDEQKQIVKFLDYKTSQITRFIKAKKRMIELLKEQKQVIINDAVTGKIDVATGMPYPKYKDSGVEWLGQVPEGWNIAKIKQISNVISKGTTPSTEGREIIDTGNIRFYKAENIVDGFLTDKPLCFIDQVTHNILKRSQLQSNDVLFVIAGATIGKITVLGNKDVPANTNQAVAFIRPNKKVIPRYMSLWLQSGVIKQIIWLDAVQSAQPNLSMTKLGNLLIPLPSKVEQESILKWILIKTSTLDLTISRTEREIPLMQEYRTRLISDVVTGKIDVRDIEIPDIADIDGTIDEPIDEPEGEEELETAEREE